MRKIGGLILGELEKVAKYACRYQIATVIVSVISFIVALFSIKNFRIEADNFIFFLSLFGMGVGAILFAWAVFLLILCSVIGGRGSGEGQEEKTNQSCSDYCILAILLVSAVFALLITVVSLLFLLSPLRIFLNQ